MVPLAIQDENARRLNPSIDEISRRLIHEAAALTSAFEFFDVAANTLFEQLPLEGIGVWLKPSRGLTADLVAAAGNRRRLVRQQIGLPDDMTLPARRSAQLKPSVNRRPAEGIAIETFELFEGSLVTVAASTSDEEADSLFPAGWLSQVLAPAIQVLDALAFAREATSLSECLVQDAMVAVIGLDLLGQCRLWNSAAEDLFGWSKSDVLARPLRIISRKDDRSWKECVNRVLESGFGEQMEITLQRWDGSELHAAVRLIPLRRENTALPNLLVCIHDKTPVQEAAKWRAVTAGVAQAAHAGGSHPVQECLQVLTSLAGFERATVWQWNPESRIWTPSPEGAHDRARASEDVPEIQKVLLQLQSVQFADLTGPVSFNSKAADRRPAAAFNVFALPLPDRQSALVLRTTASDINTVARDSLRAVASIIGVALHQERLDADLAAMRQRVTQAEKLEALGLLTTSVAHDLNNILTVVFGYAELAKQSGSSPDCLNEIVGAAEKAALLTRQLLRSGKTNRNDLAAFDIAAALTEITPLLKSLVGPNLDFQIESSPGKSLNVRMPRTEFDQLILNLVANARDAMPGGGVIRCQLTTCEPSLRDLKHNPQLRSGPCVQLRVVDSGCGMTEEVRQRIFQPFFTTKDAERGTGLGMATVRQIVDRASGGIRVESTPNVGTVMTILLPQVISDICSRIVDAIPERDPGGNESVLIIHEDPRIRELLARILELKGYMVDSRSSKESGGSGNYDLLVTESSSLPVLWPASKRTGMMLPTRLLGIADQDASPAASPGSFISTRWLVKPFTSQQLLRAVRGALDESENRIETDLRSGNGPDR